MNDALKHLAERIEQSGKELYVNLARPIFTQPEDRIVYRSFRILVILGMLNTKNGLSKEVVACVDFLLRNPGYQKKFIIEYYKSDGAEKIVNKLNSYLPPENIENDFHIIRYKSLPWDLRFNDMFLYLYIRSLVTFIGQKPNLRVILTDIGTTLFNEIDIDEIFIDEIRFLQLFGKRFNEDKTRNIITEVIPNTYWTENEKFDYK